MPRKTKKTVKRTKATKVTQTVVVNVKTGRGSRRSPKVPPKMPMPPAIAQNYPYHFTNPNVPSPNGFVPTIEEHFKHQAKFKHEYPGTQENKGTLHELMNPDGIARPARFEPQRSPSRSSYASGIDQAEGGTQVEDFLHLGYQELKPRALALTEGNISRIPRKATSHNQVDTDDLKEFLLDSLPGATIKTARARDINA